MNRFQQPLLTSGTIISRMPAFDEIDLKNAPLLAIISANLLILLTALFQGMGVGFVLWVYWLQSVIIGFFFALKILFTARFANRAKDLMSVMFFAGFFTLHYGMFHLGYSFFLLLFEGPAPINFAEVLQLGSVFFIAHLISFILTFREIKSIEAVGQAFILPYARIIPMHITIILGSMLFILGLGPIPIILFFLFLKTGADIWAHNYEHRLYRKSA